MVFFSFVCSLDDYFSPALPPVHAECINMYHLNPTIPGPVLDDYNIGALGADDDDGGSGSPARPSALIDMRDIWP